MIAAFPALAALASGDTARAMEIAREELDSPGDAAASQKPASSAPVATYTPSRLQVALAAQSTQATGLAAHIEGIVNSPLAVAEFKENVRQARQQEVHSSCIPTLKRMQSSIPAAVALLQELARED
jgi:hypothetical protein